MEKVVSSGAVLAVHHVVASGHMSKPRNGRSFVPSNLDLVRAGHIMDPKVQLPTASSVQTGNYGNSD